MDIENDKNENGKKEPENEIQRLRLYKGLEDISDEEAERVIGSIRQLADLAFDLYKKLKKSA
jgi:hypothetical protein